MPSTGTEKLISNTAVAQDLHDRNILIASGVGRLAAARLFDLVTKPETDAKVDLFWFDFHGTFRPDDADDEDARKEKVELSVLACLDMAEYAIKKLDGRETDAEQLYRHIGGKQWHNEPAVLRMALQVFIAAARSVSQAINAATLPTLHAAGIAAISPQTLKREDSIFEETESLGDLEPHAVEAARLQYKRAHAAAGRDPAANGEGTLSVGRAESDTGKAGEGNKGGDQDSEQPAKDPAPEKPLSAGEKPPAASTGTAKPPRKRAPRKQQQKPRGGRRAAKAKPSN